MFNPHTPTNMTSSLANAYIAHEKMEKWAYSQRKADVESASFTPIVLSLTGGMGKEATKFYKRLAYHLSTKWDQPYSITISRLRCSLSFSFLRSLINCFRSSRGYTTLPVLDLACHESNLSS
jgi:hypothetical protein